MTPYIFVISSFMPLTRKGPKKSIPTFANGGFLHILSRGNGGSADSAAGFAWKRKHVVHFVSGFMNKWYLIDCRNWGVQYLNRNSAMRVVGPQCRRIICIFLIMRINNCDCRSMKAGKALSGSKPSKNLYRPQHLRIPDSSSKILSCCLIWSFGGKHRCASFTRRNKARSISLMLIDSRYSRAAFCIAFKSACCG